MHHNEILYVVKINIFVLQPSVAVTVLPCDDLLKSKAMLLCMIDLEKLFVSLQRHNDGLFLQLCFRFLQASSK